MDRSVTIMSPTSSSHVSHIIVRLEALGSPRNVEGMARFGITPARTFGVRQPQLKALAKELGRDHELALELWAAGIREST